MAEVGLVRFASLALEAAEAPLPLYKAKRSKHTFTQPQLLAALCLMRFEDWTFRETEVRLREHGELRRALKLERTPDHTTLYRFMGRLDEHTLARALAEAARRVRGPEHGADAPAVATLAVDATGLSPGAISFYFVQRKHHHAAEPMPWRQYLKWIVAVDTTRQVILAQQARIGPHNDCALLRPLVSAAAELVPIGAVLADAEFDSERNHRHVREQVGAVSAIPAKRGKATWHLLGYRAQMREAFPRALFRSRALIETVFSVVKRKLSARAPGRTLRTQRLQALVLGIAYNVYRGRFCVA